MDDAKLADLKAKHPDGILVAVKVRGDKVDVFLRPPTRAEWKRWKVEINDTRKMVDAPEHLVKACVVHPGLSEFDSILDITPGAVEQCLDHCLDLAGAVGKAEVLG